MLFYAPFDAESEQALREFELLARLFTDKQQSLVRPPYPLPQDSPEGSDSVRFHYSDATLLFLSLLIFLATGKQIKNETEGVDESHTQAEVGISSGHLYQDIKGVAFGTVDCKEQPQLYAEFLEWERPYFRLFRFLILGSVVFPLRLSSSSSLSLSLSHTHTLITHTTTTQGKKISNMRMVQQQYKIRHILDSTTTIGLTRFLPRKQSKVIHALNSKIISKSECALILLPLCLCRELVPWTHFEELMPLEEWLFKHLPIQEVIYIGFFPGRQESEGIPLHIRQIRAFVSTNITIVWACLFT